MRHEEAPRSTGAVDARPGLLVTVLLVAWEFAPDPPASPDDVSATDSLHAEAKAPLRALDAGFANPDVHGISS